ncbi:MAG TPA: hypothetical protein VF147_06945 [Vicinamibacterales bacterium]
MAACVAACAVVVVASGCAKEPPAVTPQMGKITVGVTTRSSSPTALESMAFTVEIQPPGTRERIRADGGLYDEDVPPGDYRVRLVQLPNECRVDGVAERRVTVSSRRTTAVRFSVTCR